MAISQNLGLILFAFLFLTEQSTASYITQPCNDDQLKRCTDNAEPLLTNSELVVPDSQKSVNQVCTLWLDLTNCINNYTKKCMSRQQKMEFDKTFKEPVSSMSSLCENQDHRKEYLSHAPCVKKISTQERYCGNQYRFLIDIVSGSTSSIKQICCARAKFRNCILSQTPSKCDANRPGQLNEGRKLSNEMNATSMAVSILDKSFAFISQRCISSSFHEGECPGIDSTLVRTNSKGPLESSELEAAASGETSQSQGSQFQLGQRPKVNPSGSKAVVGSALPPPPKSILDPKTDKLSSSSNIPQANTKPLQQARPNTKKEDNSGAVVITSWDISKIVQLSLFLLANQ